MNIHPLLEHYWLHDGPIKSFHLDIQNNTAEIELSASRKTKGKGLIPCTLRITFQNLIEASLFDKFPTDGYYGQFCLYQGNKEIGLSFNVHDNSSQVYEKYNWVIKSKRMLWKEI